MGAICVSLGGMVTLCHCASLRNAGILDGRDAYAMSAGEDAQFHARLGIDIDDQDEIDVSAEKVVDPNADTPRNYRELLRLLKEGEAEREAEDARLRSLERRRVLHKFKRAEDHTSHTKP